MTDKKLTKDAKTETDGVTEVSPTPAEDVVAGDQVAGHDASKLKEPKAVIDKDAFGKGGTFKLNEDGTRSRIKS